MQVKLRTGSFESGELPAATTSSGGATLDKRCLLVYCGTFDSMDGEVTIKPDHLKHLAATHNAQLTQTANALGLSVDELPYKSYPPLQLDHSTSAHDTVGRVVGVIEIGSYELKDGTKVPALYGKARVLGSENVVKVEDGRWTNLSIGADLEAGTLSELTITPFPAAPEASMLSRLASHLVAVVRGEKGGHVQVHKDEMTQKFQNHIVSGDHSHLEKSPEFETQEEAMKAAHHAVKKLSKGVVMAASVKIEKYLPTPNDLPKFKYTISMDGRVVYESKAYDREDEAKSDSEKALERVKTDSSPDFSKMSKLSAGMPEGESKMHEHLKAHLKHLGVADEKHEDCLKKMHAHLMATHKLSEEAAHEHMSHMTSEHWDKYAKDMNEMSAAAGPAVEKMPASGSTMDMEHAEDKMPHSDPHANMSANRDRILKLAKGFNETIGKVNLAHARTRLSSKLSFYKTTAQLTPAELKRFDIVKLSAKPSEFVEGMFYALNKMDAKVFVGLNGTSKASELSTLSAEYKKKVRMSKLEEEVRKNMSSVADKPGEDPMAPPAGHPPAPKEKMSGEENEHTDMAEKESEGFHMSSDEGYEHMKKLMAEGKDDEAKEHFKKMMSSKHLAGEEVQPAAHEEAHEEMKKLHAHFNELIKLTGISGELSA